MDKEQRTAAASGGFLVINGVVLSSAPLDTGETKVIAWFMVVFLFVFADSLIRLVQKHGKRN